MDKLLDRAAVARLLGITLDTLKRLRAQGGFAECIKIGSRDRWRPADLQAWIDQQATDAEDRS